MAGYSVIEAANLDEATQKLAQQPVDLVAGAMDLAADGSSPLLTALRGRTEWATIPVLALVDVCGQEQTKAAWTAGFQDCQAKLDGVRVLESVTRLISPASLRATPACVGEAR
jgi:DNA-binding response OmpR family regulator